MQNTIFLKARYLSAELKECEDSFLQYYEDFFKEVDAAIGKKEDGVIANSPPESSLTSLSVYTPSNNDGRREALAQDSSFLNKKLKSLYKKIVQICHPDKHASYLSESAKGNLTKIYSDCTGAVRDGDLYFFLECASKLYIDIPPLDENEILILKKNCLKIEDDIKKIKNTYPWIWGEKDDEEQRKQILNLYIQKISK